jgi:hypothetical protein
MDFEKSLMLWCIIYRLDQVVGDVLSQSSIPKKGFIKYNTKNEITPMRTLLILHALGWLLIGSWSLLILLLKQIIVISQGREILGQVDVQSWHFLGPQVLIKR